MKSKQTPYDRVLWALVSLKGRAEWTELRIRSKLTLAELNAVLTELEKAGKIIIVQKRTGRQGPDQTTVQLKRSPPS